MTFDRVLEFAKVVHEFLERERISVALGHSFDGVGTGRQKLFTDFPHRIESVEVESAQSRWLRFTPPQTRTVKLMRGVVGPARGVVVHTLVTRPNPVLSCV